MRWILNTKRCLGVKRQFVKYQFVTRIIKVVELKGYLTFVKIRSRYPSEPKETISFPYSIGLEVPKCR
jgi:hypothetical protein